MEYYNTLLHLTFSPNDPCPWVKSKKDRPTDWLQLALQRMICLHLKGVAFSSTIKGGNPIPTLVTTLYNKGEKT